MKKQFTNAEIEVLLFNSEDAILTASAGDIEIDDLFGGNDSQSL